MLSWPVAALGHGSMLFMLLYRITLVSMLYGQSVLLYKACASYEWLCLPACMPVGLSASEPACVSAPVQSYSPISRKRTSHGMCVCY